MSLVADYSTTSSSSHSESSNDSGTDELNKQTKIAATGGSGNATVKPTLPSANLVLGGSSVANNSKKGEVFNNPFREVENAKTALLEKHVKMVNKEEHITEKNGRKICWNNRKGRCRFGSNCHYAHDSDLSVAAELQNADDVGHSHQVRILHFICMPYTTRQHVLNSILNLFIR